ncbi:MAG TPA: isochorismatase family cysteine hydrolase [Gaiellaceae bacterium]|jgi:nicotinamidase-related amidase
MTDVLLVIDALNDFSHEDGDTLLASFRERLPGLRGAIAHARGSGTPVVFVNDQHGRWDGDGPGLVRRALDSRGGDVAAAVAPRADEPLILKARYSAFDHTTLELLLRELEADRLLLAGGATEACVVQTGIDARELGYRVTLLADACATLDLELEQIALRYAEDVAGIVVTRSPPRDQ